MTDTPTATTANVDPDLHTQLERLVAEATAKPVTRVEIEPNGFSTKVSSFFVTATFPDGEVRDFFAKATPSASPADSPSGVDRELRAYRDLFADEAQNGSLLGKLDRAGDVILLFERAPGWDLRYHDLDVWADAITELARLHARFATRLHELKRFRYLVRYDADRCRVNGREAVEQLRTISVALADRARSVIAGFDPFLGELDGLPATLVHGDLAPKNVVASAAPRRITFVDWEWAGIGSGLIDVVDLLNGLDDDAYERLVGAYRTEATSTGFDGGRRDFDRALDLVSIERTIFKLSRAAEWGVETGHIEGWINEAQRRLVALGSR